MRVARERRGAAALHGRGARRRALEPDGQDPRGFEAAAERRRRGVVGQCEARVGRPGADVGPVAIHPRAARPRDGERIYGAAGTARPQSYSAGAEGRGRLVETGPRRLRRPALEEPPRGPGEA